MIAAGLGCKQCDPWLPPCTHLRITVRKTFSQQLSKTEAKPEPAPIHVSSFHVTHKDDWVDGMIMDSCQFQVQQLVPGATSTIVLDFDLTIRSRRSTYFFRSSALFRFKYFCIVYCTSGSGKVEIKQSRTSMAMTMAQCGTKDVHVHVSVVSTGSKQQSNRIQNDRQHIQMHTPTRRHHELFNLIKVY